MIEKHTDVSVFVRNGQQKSKIRLLTDRAARPIFCGASPLSPKDRDDRQRMTKMIDEQLARLRTHRNNIARYRRLLKTKLSDLERQFIARRLSEEQSDFERLAESAFPISFNISLAAAEKSTSHGAA